MNDTELKQRTKDFALRIVRLTDALPHGRASDVLGRQLLRSATSVAANYRAACRARSRSDFVAKMGIVEEEADESGFWLELLREAGLAPAQRLDSLRQEASELTAIAVSSIRTARNTGARHVPLVSEVRNSQPAGLQSAIRTPHSEIR